MSRGLVLGVDGGNTKTIALLAAADGSIVGAGRAGCSDIFNASSEAAAMAELDAAVGAALAASGQPSDAIDSAFFCMAGADWPEDFDLLRETVRSRSYGRLSDVANDAMGALRAGTTDGVGVVITCGTGVAVGARNAAGETWHSAFWAEPLGAVELGRQALWSIFRTEVGAAPPTAMTAPILQHFGAQDAEALLRMLFTRGTSPPEPVEIARLAPLILDLAERGDAAARSLVQHQGTRLAEYAMGASARVGLALGDAPIILNGGLFKHAGDVLVGSIRETLAPHTRTLDLRRSALDPAAGAVLLAFEQAGSTVSAAMLNRLTATVPPASFFGTQ